MGSVVEGRGGSGNTRREDEGQRKAATRLTGAVIPFGPGPGAALAITRGREDRGLLLYQETYRKVCAG